MNLVSAMFDLRMCVENQLIIAYTRDADLDECLLLLKTYQSFIIACDNNWLLGRRYIFDSFLTMVFNEEFLQEFTDFQLVGIGLGLLRSKFSNHDIIALLHVLRNEIILATDIINETHPGNRVRNDNHWVRTPDVDPLGFHSPSPLVYSRNHRKINKPIVEDHNTVVLCERMWDRFVDTNDLAH